MREDGRSSQTTPLEVPELRQRTGPFGDDPQRGPLQLLRGARRIGRRRGDRRLAHHKDPEPAAKDRLTVPGLISHDRSGHRYARSSPFNDVPCRIMAQTGSLPKWPNLEGSLDSEDFCAVDTKEIARFPAVCMIRVAAMFCGDLAIDYATARGAGPNGRIPSTVVVIETVLSFPACHPFSGW